MAETDKLLLRPREAATALGVAPRTLWRWTRKGVVPYVRIGKVIRYPYKALLAWVDSHSHSPPPTTQAEDTHKA
jgi:excisionase family DNA binding protein